MDYLEIESEIEARKGLAEGIRRKMADYEKSINRNTTYWSYNTW